MAQRRAGQYPNSWGGGSELANKSAATCQASSYNSTGTYTPATGAGAPAEAVVVCQSEVLFQVNATTTVGQNLYLVGNVTKLGGKLDDTDPKNLILPLNPGNYTLERPEWYVDIWLKADQTVAYQYVLQNGSQYVFEKAKNRTVRVGPCGSSKVVVTDDAATF